MKFGSVPVDQIVADIVDAGRYGREAGAVIRDGGSCNHDTVYVCFDRQPGPKVRTALSEKLRARGLGCRWSTSPLYRGCLFVDFPFRGQGARQTISCEVAARVLGVKGYDAHVFYMLD